MSGAVKLTEETKGGVWQWEPAKRWCVHSEQQNQGEI